MKGKRKCVRGNDDLICEAAKKSVKIPFIRRSKVSEAGRKSLACPIVKAARKESSKVYTQYIYY